MLTAELQTSWDRYLAVESSGTREEKLRALGGFLNDLSRQPPETWYHWARSRAEQVVDGCGNQTIHGALFEQAVFPALLDGIKNKRPGCARWLAGLWPLLLHSETCRERMPEWARSEGDLLRIALQHDPQDWRARRKLIETQAARLKYTLHELPAGVLYDADAANLAECILLEQALDEFRQLVEAENDGRYAVLIKMCSHHFRNYRLYLENQDRFRSYAEFLASPESQAGE